MVGTTRKSVRARATTYRMIDHRIHGVVMPRWNFGSAMPMRPNPNSTTSSESSESRLVDFASVSTWRGSPARTARIAVIGRMAIGPTMKTADTTCSTAKSVSMPPA